MVWMLVWLVIVVAVVAVIAAMRRSMTDSDDWSSAWASSMRRIGMPDSSLVGTSTVRAVSSSLANTAGSKLSPASPSSAWAGMLDPRTLAITGLTRNGLWLIEDGQVTTPLRNFRFTQSYAQALMPGNVVAIGSAVTPLPGDTYTATTPRWSCPALRLASWNFTGGASG